MYLRKVYAEMLLETKITTSSAVTTTYLITLLNTSAAAAATITTLAIANTANTFSNMYECIGFTLRQYPMYECNIKHTHKHTCRSIFHL